VALVFYNIKKFPNGRHQPILNAQKIVEMDILVFKWLRLQDQKFDTFLKNLTPLFSILGVSKFHLKKFGCQKCYHTKKLDVYNIHF